MTTTTRETTAADLDQPGEPTPLPSLTPGAPGSPLMRVFRAARPVGWRLALAAFLGALAIGCSVGLIATSAYLISKASLQPPILHLQVAIVSVRAFGLGRGVFRYAERVVGHDAAFRSLTDLRIAVYDRLAVIAPSGLTAYRSGDLLNRLVADVDAMLDFHLRVVLPYAVALLVGVGSVVLSAAFVPAAGVALALALLVGGVVVPALTLRLTDRTQRRVAPEMGRLTAETVTLVDGAAELIALGQADAVLDQIRATDTRLTRISGRAAVSAGVGAALGVLAQGAAVIAAVIFGTQAVTSGQLQGVDLALVVLVPLAAYEAVQVLPAAVVVLARVRESARRVMQVIDAPDPTPDPDPAAPLPHPVPAGSLQVEQFVAGWAQDEWVARPVDIECSSGQSVALVAPSGVGKSTIALGLADMVPAAGRVHYGQVDLRAVTGEDVRKVVEVVQQDAHLFDSTIAENIRLARRSITDAEITELLAEVGLGDWVAGLPDGIETRVGRFGKSVSGGQKQRIAVARGLAAQAPVLVADEPTEHLDAHNAELVMGALRRHCQERVLVLITHNRDDALSCDHMIEVHEAR